jgi:hypothetical protein
MVGSCHEIIEDIGKILLAKKNETCNDTAINKKVQQLEHTLGLLDAAFYYLNIMEQHIVPFNNKYGLREKEESFIESGHQIGIKENRRYQGMTNFQ